jgi:hypothetical protein
VTRVFDAVTGFNDVGFKRDGTGFAVELEEETAGVAEDATGFVAAPKRSCRCCAVLADGLKNVSVGVKVRRGSEVIPVRCLVRCRLRWKPQGRMLRRSLRSPHSVCKSWVSYVFPRGKKMRWWR